MGELYAPIGSTKPESTNKYNSCRSNFNDL
jgi:hypothetical protein